MTSTTLAKAVAAIRDAALADKALADARTTARSSWITAYARTKAAQEAGETQATIGKASGVGAVTVGDMLTASAIPASAWDVLDTLPARQGRRFTTVHSLVGGARKATDAATVRAIIADAAGKVAGIPRIDGADPDAEQVAKAWATCVRKLWDASGKKKETGKKDEETAPDTEDEETAPDAVNEETPDAPPSLDSRVLALAAECVAVRTALSGGASVTSDALGALVREASALTRDVSAILDAAAKQRAS